MGKAAKYVSAAYLSERTSLSARWFTGQACEGKIPGAVEAVETSKSMVESKKSSGLDGGAQNAHSAGLADTRSPLTEAHGRAERATS